MSQTNQKDHEPVQHRLVRHLCVLVVTQNLDIRTDEAHRIDVIMIFECMQSMLALHVVIAVARMTIASDKACGDGYKDASAHGLTTTMVRKLHCARRLCPIPQSRCEMASSSM